MPRLIMLAVAVAVALGLLLTGPVAGVRAERAEAVARVVAIVNQPVVPLPRTNEATVSSPGWFHPGALTPDYDTVDVHATQEFPYAKAVYATSDITPDTMFRSDELEFNAMTKLYYLDRSLPKKRLTYAEMDEINRQYRVIGRDDRTLHRDYIWIAVIAAGLLAMAVLVGRAWD